MSFVDGVTYGKDQEFTVEQLGQVSLLDVYHYLCLQAYRKQDPGPEDHPTAVRSSMLEYDKKAILYFMTSRGRDWDEGTHSRNPTRSDLVNKLFDVVRKKEVRKQGQPSQARRDLEHSEFEQMLNKLQAFPDFWKQFTYPTIAKQQ